MHIRVTNNSSKIVEGPHDNYSLCIRYPKWVNAFCNKKSYVLGFFIFSYKIRRYLLLIKGNQGNLDSSGNKKKM